MTVCGAGRGPLLWLCHDALAEELGGRWGRAFRRLHAEWWSEPCSPQEPACAAPGEPELEMVWLGPLRPLWAAPCRGCGVFWPCYGESSSFGRSQLCFHCTQLLGDAVRAGW